MPVTADVFSAFYEPLTTPNILSHLRLQNIFSHLRLREHNYLVQQDIITSLKKTLAPGIIH